jgi:citrate synthase
MTNTEKDMDFLFELSSLAEHNNRINPDNYSKYNVKRGLRNADGSGVLVGLTTIGDVHGYIIDEGDAKPVDGRLRYRGIDIRDLVEGVQRENRFGYEETAFLLLFGRLPEAVELQKFTELLAESRELPSGFTEDMILNAPSVNIMNKLARSVFSSYSYDENPDDTSIGNVLRQCIQLIARFPAMVAYGYQAKQHYHDNQSLYLHKQKTELSTAENFLQLIRPNQEYTRLEAEVLDLALILHAEHGGGNNSTFTVHVVSSTGTDTYSAIGAAVGSLKGPKHGGANHEVMDMMEDIKAHVNDWSDDSQLAEYIRKIIRKEAFDKSGLIYGMGHAVYSISDPRALLLKEKAASLAQEKGRKDEFDLYASVERLGKEVFNEEKGSKIICANVDFYSGFVYDMLNIPMDLHTPIFAISRIAGWAAHRIEEIANEGRIIRPAYKYILPQQPYVPLQSRVKKKNEQQQ